MTDYLVSIFNETLRKSPHPTVFDDVFLQCCINALKYPGYLNIYYTIKLAEAYTRTIFDKLYSLLSMTKYADLAYECKLLLLC